MTNFRFRNKYIYIYYLKYVLMVDNFKHYINNIIAIFGVLFIIRSINPDI